MLKLNYFPDNRHFALADGECEIVARQLLEESAVHWNFSNALFLTAIQYVGKREFPDKYKDIIIIFNDKELTLNVDWQVSDYPEGFCDHSINMLNYLLGI